MCNLIVALQINTRDRPYPSDSIGYVIIIIIIMVID